MPLMSSMDGNSAEVIRQICTVLFPRAQTLLDPTYGRGNFYPTAPTARLVGGDLSLSRARDYQGDCRQLPFGDQAVDLVVLDIPFQPMSTNTSALMGQQYTKVGVAGQSMRNLDAVRDLLLAACAEAKRVARMGVIVKTQNYIHARTRVWMSAWVQEALGLPTDHVTLRQASKLRSSSWQNQCSVWTNHSDFWVYSLISRYHYADAGRKAKAVS